MIQIVNNWLKIHQGKIKTCLSIFIQNEDYIKAFNDVCYLLNFKTFILQAKET